MMNTFSAEVQTRCQMAAGLLEWMVNRDPYNHKPHAAGDPALFLFEDEEQGTSASASTTGNEHR